MVNTLKEKILEISKWKRIGWMILFWLAKWAIDFVIGGIALVQLGFVLITDTPNARLLAFSRKVNGFMFHIVRFITYTVDEVPFPMSDIKEDGK